MVKGSHLISRINRDTSISLLRLTAVLSSPADETADNQNQYVYDIRPLARLIPSLNQIYTCMSFLNRIQFL